jgi:hypothetical protein
VMQGAPENFSTAEQSHTAQVLSAFLAERSNPV